MIGKYISPINLVRAFIAKAIWDIPTTRDLVLRVDRQMRNLCGWVLIHEIPSESTFSRAFAEFAESDLPGRMHEALVKEFIGAPVPPRSATPASRGNSCLKSQHDALRPRSDDTLMRGRATGLEKKEGIDTATPSLR